MDLSFTQGAWALLVTATVIGSYFLGRTVERMEFEKTQRRLARIEKVRRAS